MKLKATALAQQQFKAPVTLRFPTDEITKAGETVYGEARFIGHFRATPVSEAREHLKSLQTLQQNGDAMAAIELAGGQMEKFFIGFEAFPGEELPFTDDNDQPLQSNEQGVALLLNIKEVRDAVQKAFSDARSEDVIGKNSKR